MFRKVPRMMVIYGTTGKCGGGLLRTTLTGDQCGRNPRFSAPSWLGLLRGPESSGNKSLQGETRGKEEGT